MLERLHFSEQINAPRQKVWDTMLGDATYRQWTEVFQPGSHFVGDWEQGSKILFLGPDAEGRMGGMVSMIAESRPPEYVFIKHLGIVDKGVEVTAGEQVREWAGALENYTFEEMNGGTRVSVELDSTDQLKPYIEKTWPQALATLKELAEQG